LKSKTLITVGKIAVIKRLLRVKVDLQIAWSQPLSVGGSGGGAVQGWPRVEQVRLTA